VHAEDDDRSKAVIFRKNVVNRSKKILQKSTKIANRTKLKNKRIVSAIVTSSGRVVKKPRPFVYDSNSDTICDPKEEKDRNDADEISCLEDYGNAGSQFESKVNVDSSTEETEDWENEYLESRIKAKSKVSKKSKRINSKNARQLRSKRHKKPIPDDFIDDPPLSDDNDSNVPKNNDMKTPSKQARSKRKYRAKKTRTQGMHILHLFLHV